MLECKNPESCMKEHEQWMKNKENNIHLGEDILEFIQQEIEKAGSLLNTGLIAFTKHTEERMVDRCVSIYNLETIFKYGWVFDYYKKPSQKKRKTFDQKVSIVGSFKDREALYRTFHLILKRDGDADKWSLITLYEPYTESYQWDSSFQNRICFCDKKNM